MKTLLLMRHAKSSWKDSDVSDHERPLNKRGKKDAPKMGNLLKERELVPQIILCSTAVRAVETANMVKTGDGFTGETKFLDSLYLAEPSAHMEVLQTLPDEIERVMIIGHNPGMEGLLQILSGEIQGLSTAAVAHVVLPIDHWTELNLDTEGDLVESFSPHDLEAKEKKSKDRDKAKDKEKDKEKETDKEKDKEKEKEKEKEKPKKKK